MWDQRLTLLAFDKLLKSVLECSWLLKSSICAFITAPPLQPESLKTCHMCFWSQCVILIFQNKVTFDPPLCSPLSNAPMKTNTQSTAHYSSPTSAHPDQTNKKSHWCNRYQNAFLCHRGDKMKHFCPKLVTSRYLVWQRTNFGAMKQRARHGHALCTHVVKQFKLKGIDVSCQRASTGTFLLLDKVLPR